MNQDDFQGFWVQTCGLEGVRRRSVPELKKTFEENRSLATPTQAAAIEKMIQDWESYTDEAEAVKKLSPTREAIATVLKDLPDHLANENAALLRENLLDAKGLTTFGLKLFAVLSGALTSTQDPFLK